MEPGRVQAGATPHPTPPTEWALSRANASTQIKVTEDAADPKWIQMKGSVILNFPEHTRSDGKDQRRHASEYSNSTQTTKAVLPPSHSGSCGALWLAQLGPGWMGHLPHERPTGSQRLDQGVTAVGREH